MRTLLDTVHVNILKLTIVLSGFISLYSNSPDIFGGLGNELAFYPVTFGLAIWVASIILGVDKVHLPSTNIILLFFLFVFVIFIGGICNADGILSDKIKGITASSRFIVQFMSVILYILSAIYLFNVFEKLRMSDSALLCFVERYILISAYILGAYSFFELASILGWHELRDVVNFIDGFFRSRDVQNNIFFYIRIRSLTAEASYFAMYCGVVFPWLVLHAIRSKKIINKIWNTMFVLYFLILLIFSFSRTGYFMILAEMFAMGFLYRKSILNNISKFIFCGGILLAFVVVMIDYFAQSANIMTNIDIEGVFLSFISGEQSYDMSNTSRLGAQIAALRMFLDNPILGVGWGQFPYHYAEYIPAWAWSSAEVQVWGSNIIGTPMIPVHGLYARLLGELGILGFFLWLCIVYSMFIKSAKIRGGQCVIVSFLALCMFGFNVDGFRLYYYWMFFALIWTLQNKTTSI